MIFKKKKPKLKLSQSRKSKLLGDLRKDIIKNTINQMSIKNRVDEKELTEIIEFMSHNCTNLLQEYFDISWED